MPPREQGPQLRDERRCMHIPAHCQTMDHAQVQSPTVPLSTVTDTNHLTGQDKLCKHTSKTKDSGSSLSPVAVSRLRICPLRSAQLPSQSAQKARAALFLHAGVENDGGRQDRVRVWGMGLADHRAVHHERGHRPLQPKVQSSWRHILARESPARGWPQCHLPSRPGRNSQKSALQWLYLVKYTRAFTI